MSRNKKIILSISIIAAIAVLIAFFARYYTVGPREINYNGEMCVLYNGGIYAETGDVAERHTKFVGYLDINKRVFIEKDDDAVMYVNETMYRKLPKTDSTKSVE